jgi:hypothetical protein
LFYRYSPHGIIKWRSYVRSKVLMAANIQTMTFWNVMLCSLVGGYQCFIGISFTVSRVKDLHSNIFLTSRWRQQVHSKVLYRSAYYTVSHPRGLWFWNILCPSAISTQNFVHRNVCTDNNEITSANTTNVDINDTEYKILTILKWDTSLQGQFSTMPILIEIFL